MARIVCQSCGGKTEAGMFCEKCGAALAVPTPAAAPLTSPDTAVSPSAAPVSGVDAWSAADTAAPAERVIIHAPDLRPTRIIQLGGEPASAPSAASTPVQTTASFPAVQPIYAAVDDDDCPWLRVEVDTLTFCVAGTPGLLRLRLTALTPGIQDLHVGLSLRGPVGSAVRDVVWPRPRQGLSREMSLTIPPLRPGAYPAEIDVRMQRDGESCRFEATIEAYVYPADCPASRIAESIVVNITNDIKVGHASDVRLSQDAAEAMGRFVSNGRTHGVGELLNLLKTDQRAFRREKLYEGDCLPGSGGKDVPDAARTDQVTLRAGDRLIHLLAGRQITLGKNRGNRIITRLFESDGSATAERNGRISKFHCLMEYREGTCWIHDGAPGEDGKLRPSTCGVFWQGHQVRGNESFDAERFPSSASLWLAGEGDAWSFGFTVQGCFFDAARCALCGGREGHACRHGRMPAVVLRRCDEVPEIFVLLWSCFDLGQVVPGLRGVTLCHDHGAFAWRSEIGSGWLVPGGTLAAGGAAVPVQAFAQYGL